MHKSYRSLIIKRFFSVVCNLILFYFLLLLLTLSVVATTLQLNYYHQTFGGILCVCRKLQNARNCRERAQIENI